MYLGGEFNLNTLAAGLYSVCRSIIERNPVGENIMGIEPGNQKTASSTVESP